MNEKIRQLLTSIYDAETADRVLPRVNALLQEYGNHVRPQPASPYFDHRDAVLITYADMVQRDGERPLQTLVSFLHAYLREKINTVHLLPFYPYSSDDGFSVIDYRAVDPALGTWKDVEAIGRDFRLMFDAVVNHISARSEWFQRFLDDDPAYRDFFVTVNAANDLSAVFRPRVLPLLTEVMTTAGRKHVWTTFSADQIDLNYANPELLLEIIALLLFYVVQGAGVIRLDAIAFLWKEVGTSCIHRPQTHAIIQLFRAVLDVVAPHVALVTETNVPHAENVSYFGNGANEAQMVYNFSLPPLVLHAFHTGNAETLTRWAAGLTLPPKRVTFFNFLASHDGIGLTPVRGILSDKAINELAARIEALGGYVSNRHNADGRQSAYELNLNYLDALGDPERPNEEPALVTRRFLAAQAIMLALRGVPGIYFHSLFGSRSWREGVVQTGRNRTINREKCDYGRLIGELNDVNHLRHQAFQGYSRLLRHRQAAGRVFDPYGAQTLVSTQESVFAVWRCSPGASDQALCLHNVSAQPQSVEIDWADLPVSAPGQLTDLVADKTAGNQHVLLDGRYLNLTLTPYQVAWLFSSEESG
jgi:sucrose phosphorylase